MGGAGADRGPVVLACGADDAYAMPLAVTLHSALARLRRDVAHVYVLDGGLGEPARRRLAGVVRRASAGSRLDFVAADLGRLAGVKVEGHYNASNYLRLLIPEVVPEAFGRAIYLDSDLLVRADLGALWRADLGGKAVLAAVDLGAPTLSSRRGLANFRQLGLDPGAPYVNSGVLVLDLARWRAEGIGPRIMRHSLEHREHVRFADQDGINAVLSGGGDCGLLDPRWNVPAFVASDRVVASLDDTPLGAEPPAARRRMARDAFILHFVGARKPWQFGAGLPGQWEWLRELDRSGWHGPAAGPRLRGWALRADWLARSALRRLRG